MKPNKIPITIGMFVFSDVYQDDIIVVGNIDELEYARGYSIVDGRINGNYSKHLIVASTEDVQKLLIKSFKQKKNKMTAKEFLQDKYPLLQGNKWNSNPAISDDWVSRMMEEYADHITAINKHPEPPEWKKGDWLIREWDEEVIDLTLYDYFIDNNTFSYLKFYRFINEKIDQNLSSLKDKTTLINSKTKIQWRLATEEEITKYARIIIEG